MRPEAAIGRTVLVSERHERADGALLAREQAWGILSEVDPASGHLVLVLGGTRAGEVKRLPVGLDALEPAERGDYRLAPSGERVLDPDFTCVYALVEG